MALRFFLIPVQDIDVFSRLRELRKELAQTEAVPVYAFSPPFA